MAKKRNNISRTDSFSATYFNFRLKAMKKSLGSKVRHLANRRTLQGERFIEVGVETSNGYKMFEFSLPMNIVDITNADYDRLEELIKSKM